MYAFLKQLETLNVPLSQIFFFVLGFEAQHIFKDLNSSCFGFGIIQHISEWSNFTSIWLTFDAILNYCIKELYERKYGLVKGRLKFSHEDNKDYL